MAPRFYEDWALLSGPQREAAIRHYVRRHAIKSAQARFAQEQRMLAAWRAEYAPRPLPPPVPPPPLNRPARWLTTMSLSNEDCWASPQGHWGSGATEVQAAIGDPMQLIEPRRYRRTRVALSERALLVSSYSFSATNATRRRKALP